ncbi:MBL fold metallo-hydrolase [Pseudaquabacterium rugosum]|uniref:MBL fold metallo-hydrolase n=1 Tax=Pseudaquabacterium rugosum TaxID=2984194 RepID=A0ABU9B617_9BURK
MRVVILRGGAPRRSRQGPRHEQDGRAGGTGRQPPVPSTRERGALAIGNDQGQWVLVNVSPAVAHQLDSDPRLERLSGLPDARMRAVVLTDAQVDHVGGLLSLRDGAPIDLYATPSVFEELTSALPVLPVLQHYCGVHWHVVPVAGDRLAASFRVEGLPELEFTALAVETPVPPHLAHTEHPRVGDAIALAVRDLNTGQRLFTAPGLAQLGEVELAWMREADCLLLDGPGEEPGRSRRATRDWLGLLSALPARHKVVFDGPGSGVATPDSDTMAHWVRGGIALAYDGMEIAL